MMLKKFHGATVKEARQKAQGELGTANIIVESKAAVDNEPAWVNVLHDGRKTTTGTYSRQDLFPKALTKLRKTINESFQIFDVKNKEEKTDSIKQKVPQKKYSIKPTQKPSSELAGTSGRDVRVSFNSEQKTPFRKELQVLTERFDQLEQLISGQTIENDRRYIAHPAFQQLQASGVPRATIDSWFNELLKSGADPYNNDGNFRQLLADRVKQTIDIAAEDKPANVMLFTGPAAAGKSSLIMKQALRFTLLNDAVCALVTVYPFQRENYYSPLEKFSSDHDIGHYVVRDTEGLYRLTEEATRFDHILVEMPSSSRSKSDKSLTEEHFKQQLAVKKSLTLEIHHVINATLNQQCLKEQCFFGDPDGSHYLAFTHLDEITTKGHLLPVMQQSGCKVRYVSDGPLLLHDISEFEPARFAKQLLEV
jgi:flagellar biosynthesis GTPase FlhF